MSISYYQKNLKLTVHFPKALLENIFAISKQCSPNEIGGILIGFYSDSGNEAFVEQFLIPKKNKQNRTLFTRTAVDINTELLIIYEKTKGAKYYIGEWHSHPNSTSQFSNLDLKSITEIAKDKNIKIDSPLMLIISFGTNYANEAIYIFYKEKIYAFDKFWT